MDRTETVGAVNSPTNAQALLDALPDPVLVIDADGALIDANRAAEEAFEVDAGEWVGENVIGLVHPDDVAMVLVSMDSVAEKGLGAPIQLRLRAGNTWRHFEIRGRTGEEPIGATNIVLVARDTTERRRFEVAGGTPERLAAIVHNAETVLMTLDAHGVIKEVNAAVARITGWDPEALVGTTLAGLVAVSDRVTVNTALQGGGARHTRFDAELRRPEGATIPFEFHVTDLLDDPLVEAYVVSAHDVSALRATQRDLEHLATHDALTGLANRTLLLDRLDGALARWARQPGAAAVLFIDLDRFKPINDLHGHDVGDAVLTQVAERLQRSVRPGDTVARIGGDEFVVIAEGLRDRVDATVLAERLENEVSAPYDVEGVELHVFASVGVAVNEAGLDGEALLAEADGAMYAVKARRRGASTWSSEPVSRRRSVAAELGDALVEGTGIEVFYQPVVRINTGAPTTLNDTCGFEALVRWRHPREGLLYPGAFLAIAEEAGLSAALGEIVIDAAVGQLAAWNAAGYDDVTMAVNLSASQLVDRSGTDAVIAAAQRHGVAPADIVVEVTEHALLERHAAGTDRSVIDAVTELVDAGVQVAIDDFGTGYSSLTHVRTLPVHSLKADASFVAGIAHNSGDRDLVAAVAALGAAMGMTVVAEGVTDGAQIEALAEMGCAFAQGFLFSEAVTAAAAGELLRRRTPRPVDAASTVH